ncbi:MAG TPA: ABC transporter ATP-binding protein, partial [Bacillota bacterium]|nr:ABC transporter ATP-binding protein [Bacillota bacterium]
MNDVLLDIKNLKKYFQIATTAFTTMPLKAVDDVSFYIKRGETVGLVGESGCGKTTVGRTILNLYKPTSGDIIFEGERIDSA